MPSALFLADVKWNPSTTYVISSDDLRFLPVPFRITVTRADPGIILYWPGVEVLLFAAILAVYRGQEANQKANEAQLESEFRPALVPASVGFF